MLFAVREVVQESLGNSTSELAFVQSVWLIKAVKTKMSG